MRKQKRIAIIGAGDLAAQDFLKRLLDAGLDANEIITFGSRVGPWEVSLDAESAEIFLPLEKQYLDEATLVFIFSCDQNARRSVSEWSGEIGATLVDASGHPLESETPIDPFGDLAFLSKDRKSVV